MHQLLGVVNSVTRALVAWQPRIARKRLHLDIWRPRRFPCHGQLVKPGPGMGGWNSVPWKPKIQTAETGFVPKSNGCGRGTDWKPTGNLASSPHGFPVNCPTKSGSLWKKR